VGEKGSTLKEKNLRLDRKGTERDRRRKGGKGTAPVARVWGDLEKKQPTNKKGGEIAKKQRLREKGEHTQVFLEIQEGRSGGGGKENKKVKKKSKQKEKGGDQK